MIRDPVDEWRELSALYEQADELDPSALAAWLAGLEAQAHPLLPSLKRMLEARARVQSEDFLGALPAVADAEPPPSAVHGGEGARIGPYRLLRHLGRGGMAEVWLAKRDDGAFERQVAIKLLFRHAASTERVALAQRFARERDILASLHHPNIAALHDAGVTPDGQPWLALEYVEGEPITAWCDRQRLDIAGRVRLFRQVLLAVQHAHANLVIHRDLKPANILVTAQGEVRLLDFGIAKLQEAEGGALEETELTRQGGRPLTLAYASPEQVLGKPLTTACDVYALGVVLYELLAGERPYRVESDSSVSLERAILELEPEPINRATIQPGIAAHRSMPAAALRAALRGDLAAVVHKALEKLPAGRYASVEAFNADLERWGTRQPVIARAQTPAYRLRKFVGRHKWAVAGVAAASVAVMVASVAALVFGLRAQAQAARALAASRFYSDIVRSADPNQTPGGVSVSATLSVARDRAIAHLAEWPDVEFRTLMDIATVQRRNSDYVEARRTLLEAVALARRIGPPSRFGEAQVLLAEVVDNFGDSREALQLLDEVARIAEKSKDPNLRTRYALIRGWALNHDRRHVDAVSVLSAGLSEARQAYGDVHIRTIDVLRALADAESAMNRYGEAASHLAEASSALRRLPNAMIVDVVGVASAEVRLRFLAGEIARANALAAAAETQCESLLGDASTSCGLLHLLHAYVALRRGDLSELARHTSALERQAAETRLRVRQHEALIAACRAYAALGTIEAHAGLRDRLAQLAKSPSTEQASAAMQRAAMLAMAEIGLRERDVADAGRWLDAFQSAIDADPVVDVSALQGRAFVLRALAFRARGDHLAATEWLQRADRELVAKIGADHSLRHLYALNGAASRAALGDHTAAIALLDATVPLVERSYGADAPIILQAKALRARLSREHLRGAHDGPMFI